MKTWRRKRWNKTKGVIQDIYTTLGTTVGDKATEYEHHFKRRTQ